MATMISPTLSATTSGGYKPSYSRSNSGNNPANAAAAASSQSVRQLPTAPQYGHNAANTSSHRASSSLSRPASTSPINHIRPLPSPSRSPNYASLPPLSLSRSISPLPPPAGTQPRSSSASRAHATSSVSPYRQSHSHSNGSSASGSGSTSRPTHTAASGSKSAPLLTNSQQNHGTFQQRPHPSFVNQHLPAFGGAGGAHAFPNPQYPFMPSPHPSTINQNTAGNNLALNFQPGPYSPGFAAAPPTTSSAAENQQQHQARLIQEAHRQQHQWQMEMLRQQQQQQGQGGNEDAQGRRRATSGPASHSPQTHTASLPYPPTPSPTQQLKSLPIVAPMSSLPAGAMMPHGQGAHGYPTPPGSVEGRDSGGSNGSRDGYHPYRRHGKNDSTDREREERDRDQRSHSPANPRQQQQHSRQESSSSALSNGVKLPAASASVAPGKPSPVPSASSSSVHTAGSSSRHHANSSTTSVSSSIGGRSSARSTPPPGPYANLPNAPRDGLRTRTDSGQSLSSLDSAHNRPARKDSFESARSANAGNTSSGANSMTTAGKKPSPLSRQYDSRPGPSSSASERARAGSISSASRMSGDMTDRPGTPGTLRGAEDDDEDSDDTAGGARNTPVVLTGAALKDKSKGGGSGGGMKSRWKKAFGGGSSSSSSAAPVLKEADVNGRGPRAGAGVVQGQRPRADTSSSSESESSHPHTPPNAHYQQHQREASASTIGSSSRPPPASSSSAPRRLGIFNSKLNSSTDNLSISSTVSSASVMIRKLGQMGKMARRNSMMSLTKAFKKDSSATEVDEDGRPVVLSKEELKAAKKKDKDNKKKGVAAQANVSHVTAEVESQRFEGMSPAAALAKKHQQQYAEQEAAAAAAAEAERQRVAAAAAAAQQKAAAESMSVKAKMLEKEKEKLKKSKGRKWGFGGSKKDGSTTGADDTSSFNDGASIFDDSRSTSALSHYPESTIDNGGSSSHVEVLASSSPHYAAYGATRREGDAHSVGAGSEYEPSLVETAHARREFRHVRGILKGAGSYRQDDYAMPKPPNFPRVRASSFDAPNQQRPGSPGQPSALVNTIPSEAQVDGLAPSSTTSRYDTRPPSPNTSAIDRQAHHPHSTPAAPTAIPLSSGSPNLSASSSPYGNPALNNSAPALSQFGRHHPLRSASAPGGSGRRITFAQNLSVHTTWPAAVYDRRAEPATCNRLTPTLAQQIKEELNSFKMEEMDVHPSSRQLTHFFV